MFADWQPVKFAELCSSFNQKIDGLFDNGAGEFALKNEANEYIGVACECMTHSRPKRCRHSQIQRDRHLVEFLVSNLTVSK